MRSREERKEKWALSLPVLGFRLGWLVVAAWNQGLPGLLVVAGVSILLVGEWESGI